MTKYDLKDAGLPGVEYEFVEGGNIHIFRKGDIEHNFEKHPWKAKEEEMGRVANLLDEKLSSIRKAIVVLAEAYSKADKKKIGKPEGDYQEWVQAANYSKGGDVTGLKHGVIGDLMAPNYIVVDDMLVQIVDGAMKIVSREALSTAILNHLEKVDLKNAYATNTEKLVRDNIRQKAPKKKLGPTQGFLPMTNGLLDIAKGCLVPTDDVYLVTTNMAFDPDAKECPKIETMLNNMFRPDQKELALSIIGAAISGRKAPFILALSGQGRNGKTQLFEIIQAMMAKLITTEPAENITRDFINDVFLGKRIVWQSEVSSKRAFTDKLKDISGGTTIQVRQKYINGCLQAPLRAVVILDTNTPPHLEDSKAIADRLRYISMPHVFVFKLSEPRDPREILIDPKLIEGWENELPAFFNMLLPYAQYFLENGKLMKDIEGTVQQYQQASNVLSGFIDNYCELTDGDERMTLYKFVETLKRYAKIKNTGIPEKEQISHKLRKEYGLTLRANYIFGLKLKDHIDLENFTGENR